MKDVLRALNQRPVAYYPIYAVGTGSISCAVALSQLMYWFSASKDKIYKTDAEMQAETGLSAKEMRTVKKKLKELPFLSVTREGVPARTFYEIDWEEYQSSMSQWAKLNGQRKQGAQRDEPVCPNGTNCDVPMVQTITESTQRLPKENVATAPVADKSDDDLPTPFSATMIEAIEVANHLSSKLSKSMDNFKAPSTAGMHKWAKDIDLAIRKDDRTKSQLIELVDWIHGTSKGAFWIGNIRSGKKLRDQFDTMWFQMSESKPTVPVRTRALEAFGKGKVFFKYTDTADNAREVHVCLFGDYGALYDYRGNKYIEKVKADKVWKHIDDNFDRLVADFKKAA